MRVIKEQRLCGLSRVQCRSWYFSESRYSSLPGSRGVLSTYGREATLWVISPRGEVPIGEYTPLYQRYAEVATLTRLYAAPERADEARRLLGLR